MAESIKLTVNLDTKEVDFGTDKILTLQQQLRILKQELQKVPEGTAEWTVLQNKFNETKDNLDRVNVKSRELFGTISALPGPIGNVGRSLDGTISTLKVFSGFTFKDFKNQFAALGKDVVDIGKSFANLTGIQAVYTAALNFFTPAAGAATLATRALAVAATTLYTALGVGLIILLVEGGKALYNWYQNANDAAAAQNKFNKSLSEAKTALDNVELKEEAYFKVKRARAKAAGEDEITLSNIDLQALRGREDNLRKRINLDRADFLSAENLVKERKRQGKELTEDEKKNYDESAAALKKSKTDLFKLQTEIQVQELGILGTAREENKKLSDQKIQDQLDYNERYFTEVERGLKLELALHEKYKEKFKKLGVGIYDTREEAKKEKEEKLEREKYFNERYAQLLEESNKKGLGKFLADKAVLFQKESDLNDQYAAQQIVNNDAIRQSYLDLGTSLGQTFYQTATLLTKGSDAQKVFGILSVVANAASGIGNAIIKGQEAQANYNAVIAAGVSAKATGAILLTNPLTAPLGVARIAAATAATAAATAGKIASRIATGINIASIAAASAAQIAAITSAGKSSSTSAGSSSAGSSSGGDVNVNLTPSIGGPVIGPTSSEQGGIASVVAGALDRNNSQNRPIRAYVVGNDITTEQQLERRIRAAARLGG
jgi:hypothetical protein